MVAPGSRAPQRGRRGSLREPARREVAERLRRSAALGDDSRGAGRFRWEARDGGRACDVIDPVAGQVVEDQCVTRSPLRQGPCPRLREADVVDEAGPRRAVERLEPVCLADARAGEPLARARSVSAPAWRALEPRTALRAVAAKRPRERAHLSAFEREPTVRPASTTAIAGTTRHGRSSSSTATRAARVARSAVTVRMQPSIEARPHACRGQPPRRPRLDRSDVRDDVRGARQQPSRDDLLGRPPPGSVQGSTARGRGAPGGTPSRSGVPARAARRRSRSTSPTSRRSSARCRRRARVPSQEIPCP